MIIINTPIVYDNCKNCKSHCEHAGKDREFICHNGESCKVVSEEKTIHCTPAQFETIKSSLEYFADLPWWDIEPEQLAEVKEALKAVYAAERS